MSGKDTGRVPVWAILQEARRRAGLSRAELAERAGTSRAAVTRYETARTEPSIATLDRLVAACGLELRMSLAEPDVQRRAAANAAAAMSVEDRLLANERAGSLVAELTSQ